MRKKTSTLNTSSNASRIFDIVNAIFLTLLAVVTLYPFYYVAIISLSGPSPVLRGEVYLFPREFSLASYAAILKNVEFYGAFLNSVYYTALGTAINLFMTVLAAYPLSIKTFSGKKFMSMMVVVAMLTSGGMIPTYLLVKSLGMLNTVWALVIPGAIRTWNMVVIRTYFQELPESLRESARIDGANDFTILFRITLPLSLPVLATIGLFYSVGHWNSFMPALIYLTDKKMYPLQLVLRMMLVENYVDPDYATVNEDSEVISLTIKYAAVMVSTLPILFVYPFIQKYFVKGALVGSLKG